MHTLVFINVLYILQVVVFILIIAKRVYPVARASSDMYFNNEAPFILSTNANQSIGGFQKFIL